jgi:hypothetical protein
MIDLDHPAQPMGDLTSREIVPMKSPESVAARGPGVVADSIRGEESSHVWVVYLRLSGRLDRSELPALLLFWGWWRRCWPRDMMASGRKKVRSQVLDSVSSTIEC